jgi:hypothetical protein
MNPGVAIRGRSQQEGIPSKPVNNNNADLNKSGKPPGIKVSYNAPKNQGVAGYGSANSNNMGSSYEEDPHI